MIEAQQKVLESIRKFPDQCTQAWEETQKLEFGSRYDEVWKVVSCGMGASGLPAHIITSAFKTNVPIVSVNDYNLPSWVNEHTLVYLSSYSGNTEEVLSCAAQAKENGCMVTGATTGGLPAGRQGKLGEWFEENNYTAYVYSPKHNPSEQPRMGLGYGIFAQLGILAKLDVISDVEDATSAVDSMRSGMGQIETTAHEFAEKVKDNALIVFGAEHLAGNAHVFANQVNETAKTFASWFSLPEANHHLLEGLKHPEIPLTAIFLESEKYTPDIKKRMDITKQVVEKNGHSVQSYSIKRPSLEKLDLLSEVLDVLMFSSYASLYLAEAYNEDPITIPSVDYFKKELAKRIT